MSSNNKIYVRLKKVDKPKGFLCRRFMYRGNLFRSGEWRLVPKIVAEELAGLIQPNSENSPRALFDIAATREEAEAMDHVDIPATQVSGARVSDEFRGLEGRAKEELLEGSKLLEPAAAGEDEKAPDHLDLDDADEDGGADKEDPEPEKKAESKPKRARSRRSRK